MTGLVVGLAIWGACFLTGIAYLLASLRTFREQQPPPHPNGRCTICGLDAQEA